jgi:hypothetical protein
MLPEDRADEFGQLFRSFNQMARGLRKGSDLAYGAVMQPQEGTILTVVREAAEEAEAAREESDLVEAVRRVVGRAHQPWFRMPSTVQAIGPAYATASRCGVREAGSTGDFHAPPVL